MATPRPVTAPQMPMTCARSRRSLKVGRDLFPVLVALMQWGDRWLADDGPPLRFVHEPCQHVTSPRLACEHCGGDVDVESVRAKPS